MSINLRIINIDDVFHAIDNARTYIATVHKSISEKKIKWRFNSHLDSPFEMFKSAKSFLVTNRPSSKRNETANHI